jgi:hypothetical protein
MEKSLERSILVAFPYTVTKPHATRGFSRSGLARAPPKLHHAADNKNVTPAMHASFRFLATLFAGAFLVGCEGQTLQESVSATISSLKVDRTGIDDQGNPRSETLPTTPKKPEVEPPSPDRVRFNAYTITVAFARRLKEAAITNDAYLGRSCAKPYQTKPLSILHQPEPPLSMPKGADYPDVGIWRVRYALERCGEKITYNAVFGARAGETPNMRISTPGTTMAGSELAREIRSEIGDTALERASMEKCSDQRIVDTVSRSMLRDAESDGSIWSELTNEVWTMDVCGRLVDIPLQHGFRDGVGYPQYIIDGSDDEKWRPSGRSVPKDVDLNRLQTALLEVASGKSGASLGYLWAEARREVPFAQTVIAGLLRDGIGMPRDIDRAAFWALRASYGGYPGAMEMVGDLYESGGWIVRDRRLAAAWYRRAIERGSTTAKAKLESMRKSSKPNAKQ